MTDFFKETSLVRKTVWGALILAVTPLVLYSYLSYNIARETLFEQVDQEVNLVMRGLSVMAQSTFELVEESLVGELSAFRFLFDSVGQAQIVDGQMVLDGAGGRYVVNGRSDLVDQMRAMSGSRATIFQKIDDTAVRIATNVETSEGGRAIGTLVSDAVYEAVIERGQTYLGVADVVGTRFMTAYEPIRDPAGSIIGILFVGIPQDAMYASLFETITAIRIGESGHVSVLDSDGVLMDLGFEEATGFLPLADDIRRQIVDSRETAMQQAVKVPASREQPETWFLHFDELDWTFVVQVYPRELSSPLSQMRVSFISILFGLIAITLFVAIAVSNRLKHRTRSLVTVARHLEDGKLDDADNDVRGLVGSSESRDEFTLIANAFHEAVGALRDRDVALGESARAFEAKCDALTATLGELTRTQNILMQNEKMTSIGHLAAGVAHEINNPMGFINSNVHSLKSYSADVFSLLAEYEASRDKLPSDERARIHGVEEDIDLTFLREDVPSMIDETLEGCARVLKIVADMKDFSRSSEMSLESVDINKVVESAINVAWNEIKYKADLERNLAELPAVECDAGQISQVLVNILVNGVHALTEFGKLKVSTQIVGDKVTIDVEDNGQGVAPENLGKLFDPFFTTKPVGTGTGLGLYLSQQIVKKHGGLITVVSELGEGTKFSVSLPMAR